MTPAAALKNTAHPWNMFSANNTRNPRTSPPQPGAPTKKSPTTAETFKQLLNLPAAAQAAADDTTPPDNSGPPPAGSPNGGTTDTQANISNAAGSLASDQTTFLKLLTVQLQNQDPLSPMDTNAFTQQLVAMTGVQQQILSNQLLQQMVTSQGGLGNSVSLIGKEVKVSTGAATLQSGNADWNYNLADGASKVTFTVIDPQGKTVWQGDQSALAAGNHTFSWNGKDLTGVQRDDGQTFGLKISAQAADGSAVSSTTWLQGTVSSIQQINGEGVAIVDGTQVPLSLIATVTGT